MRRSEHGKEATNGAEWQQGLEMRPHLELQGCFFSWFFYFTNNFYLQTLLATTTTIGPHNSTKGPKWWTNHRLGPRCKFFFILFVNLLLLMVVFFRTYLYATTNHNHNHRRRQWRQQLRATNVNKRGTNDSKAVVCAPFIHIGSPRLLSSSSSAMVVVVVGGGIQVSPKKNNR